MSLKDRGEIISERHFLLNGKVVLHQGSAKAHRAGLDAVMLAASVSKNCREVVDLGAGVGSAGLCVAARLEKAKVVLVENHTETLYRAKKTLNDPENCLLKGRVEILNADVTLRGEERIKAGLSLNMADCVIMNPPYWQQHKTRPSPNEERAKAYILGKEGLLPWVKTACAILRPAGQLCLIFPAEGLDHCLEVLKGRFGGLDIFPLYKGEGEPARRIIIRGVKASRAPLTLWQGLLLHEMQGKKIRRDWTPKANSILKGERELFI